MESKTFPAIIGPEDKEEEELPSKCPSISNEPLIFHFSNSNIKINKVSKEDDFEKGTFIKREHRFEAIRAFADLPDKSQTMGVCVLW